MAQADVVNFPKNPKSTKRKTPESLAADVRKAYRALERALNAAHEAGLTVRASIDATDRYAYGVRTHDVEITKKV
jgi:hypothetical protein